MDKVVVSAAEAAAGKLTFVLEDAITTDFERRTVQPKTNTVNGGSK